MEYELLLVEPVSLSKWRLWDFLRVNGVGWNARASFLKEEGLPFKLSHCNIGSTSGSSV